MEASVDELKLVRGIGDKSAILINLTLMLAKEYVENCFDEHKRIVSVDDLVEYANIHTLGATNELVWLCLWMIILILFRPTLQQLEQ